MSREVRPVPGDLIVPKLSGVSLRPTPNFTVDGWTPVKHGDLLMVVGVLNPVLESDPRGMWTWCMLLHYRTGRYGWMMIFSRTATWELL